MTKPARKVGLEELAAEITACRRCPRLVEHREQAAREKRRAYRGEEYWGRPLPGFGDPQARVLVVGLAPAAHGGNRTGRMFTGDSSADWLLRAMHRAGLANRPTSRRRGDGLRLEGAFITAACRCAPPQNRPTGSELATCRPFLEAEFRLLPEVRVMVALGRIAFDACLHLWALGGKLPRPRPVFRHGAVYPGPGPLPVLVASYHPSRQNTQTGRLTEAMLDEVFAKVRSLAFAPPPS